MKPVGTNRGQLSIMLNGHMLTGTPVWERSTDLFTTWRYELLPDQLSLLADGPNRLQLVAEKAHLDTVHVLDAYLNAEVKVTNGFLNCDGSETFVSVPFDQQMAELTRGDFTVMAWVRLPAAAKGGGGGGGGNGNDEPAVIASRGGGNSTYWVLYDRGGDGAGFRVHWADGSTASAVENLNLPADSWFHIAATYDAVSLIVYVNGRAVGETEAAQRKVAGHDDFDTPLFIGAMWDGESDYSTATAHLTGYIDDLTLWAEGRSAQQVKQDMVLSQLGKSYEVEATGAPADGEVEAASLEEKAKEGSATAEADKEEEDKKEEDEKEEAKQATNALDGAGAGSRAKRPRAANSNSSNGTGIGGAFNLSSIAPEKKATLLLMFQFEEPVGSVSINATSEIGQRDEQGSSSSSSGEEESSSSSSDEESSSSAGSSAGGGDAPKRTAAVHGKVGISRTVHAAEVYAWKDCPGASADGAPKICGGMTDGDFKIRGQCDLTENPPRCKCNPGFSGDDCTKECPPAPGTTAICSGNGQGGKTKNGCFLAKPGAVTHGGPVLVGLYPDTTAPWWCQCKTAKDGSPRFMGKFCEHECPMSTATQCSGHGECVIARVPKEGAADDGGDDGADDDDSKKGGGDESGDEDGGEDSSTREEVFCRCQDGYFGAGCEQSCPGMLDGDRPSVKHECGGHGMCRYEKPEHNSGTPPGPGVAKKCHCNYNAGWFEEMHSGGNCVLGCPGAPARGKKKSQCDMTRFDAASGKEVPNTECSAEGQAERDAVCNGAGLPIPLGKAKAKALATDMRTHKMARGCFIRSEDRSQSNNGPDSACFYCDNSKAAAAVARVNGGNRRATGPSCAAVDQRAGSKVWRSANGGRTNSPDSDTRHARGGNVFSEAFSCLCPAGGTTRSSFDDRNENMKSYYDDQCFTPASFGDYSRRFYTRWSDYHAARKSTQGKCSWDSNWKTSYRRCI